MLCVLEPLSYFFSLSRQKNETVVYICDMIKQNESEVGVNDMLLVSDYFYNLNV